MIGRIVLLLALALAVGLYFPDSRAVILDYASPAINPYLRMSTEAEMQDIADELKTYQRENFEQLPSERQFPAWLESRFTGDGSLDGWGNTYEYRLTRDEMLLVSWGQDGERETDDDIVVTRPIRTGY